MKSFRVSASCQRALSTTQVSIESVLAALMCHLQALHCSADLLHSFFSSISNFFCFIKDKHSLSEREAEQKGRRICYSLTSEELFRAASSLRSLESRPYFLFKLCSPGISIRLEAVKQPFAVGKEAELSTLLLLKETLNCTRYLHLSGLQESFRSWSKTSV